MEVHARAVRRELIMKNQEIWNVLHVKQESILLSKKPQMLQCAKAALKELIYPQQEARRQKIVYCAIKENILTHLV